MQLAGRLRERLSIRLPIKTLFETPTVRELAARIDAMLDSDCELADLLAQAERRGS
jgi:hypothetical protein